ncbi:MAG: nitrilase-related carbon-nitrogen hydrolase [Nitrospira sp.]
MAICYESHFPDLVRQFAANGAEFLVTITNDGWFGASSAPARAFRHGCLPVGREPFGICRSANTGITGAIDPFGHILQSTPIFTEEAVEATIPVFGSRAPSGGMGMCLPTAQW